MNDIFNPFLRKKNLLVFFDVILIYNATWSTHLEHLLVVFKILETHSLLVKLTKYVFGVTMIEYLGYFISWKGVSMDPNKVKVVAN